MRRIRISVESCERGKADRPGVIAGDVVEERLGLVVVTVGAQRVALLIGVPLAVLGLHPGVAFILSVHSFLRLLDLFI